MRINVRALGILIFAEIILYLAGAYFGGPFITLFYLLIIFPVVSILLLVLWFTYTRYVQTFSTLRPVKGQDVQYTLSIGNEGVFPLPNVEVSFKSIGPLMRSALPPLSTYVQGGELVKNQFTIQCPYRGIYTIGLERLTIHDLLRLVTIHPKAHAETFYVYPRVLELTRFLTATDSYESISEGTSAGGVPDYTLFNQLKEYRRGESIRHISWKKFAATGKPFLREFDSTASPDVRLYLDLRESGFSGTAKYEQEDVSVEIVVALVRFFLDRSTGITVSAPGETAYQFTGDAPEHFAEFYDSTINLRFQRAISPAALYRSDRANGLVKSKSIIVVTHIMDPDVFALAEEYLEVERSITIIFNHTGHPAADQQEDREFIHRLRQKGAVIFEVEGPATIMENLENTNHAFVS